MLRARFVRQRLNGGKLRFVDVLSIDRNESLAASRRDHLCPKALQNLHKKVAPHSGMLIDQNAPAAERQSFKEVCIAIHILCLGLTSIAGQITMTRFEKASFVE